jgi:hypothetical protein
MRQLYSNLCLQCYEYYLRLRSVGLSSDSGSNPFCVFEGWNLQMTGVCPQQSSHRPNWHSLSAVHLPHLKRHETGIENMSSVHNKPMHCPQKSLTGKLNSICNSRSWLNTHSTQVLNDSFFEIPLEHENLFTYYNTCFMHCMCSMTECLSSKWVRLSAVTQYVTESLKLQFQYSITHLGE